MIFAALKKNETDLPVPTNSGLYCYAKTFIFLDMSLKKEQFKLGNRSVDLAIVLNVFFSRVFRNDKEMIKQ